VAAAPYGSASILPISWSYHLLLGRRCLTQAMRIAIINVNYIAKRLEGAYPVLYKEVDERVAHKCVIDADATAGGNHPLPLNQ
jgi:glycine dehydrogenase